MFFPSVPTFRRGLTERNLEKEQLMQLAGEGYLQRGENILITGATGCGKSYLACALGYQACALGYRTLYFNMAVCANKSPWPKPMAP